MTAQQYDTVDLVLDGAWEALCGATKATANFTWQCIAQFHGDHRHYYVRAL